MLALARLECIVRRWCSEEIGGWAGGEVSTCGGELRWFRRVCCLQGDGEGMRDAGDGSRRWRKMRRRSALLPRFRSPQGGWPTTKVRTCILDTRWKRGWAGAYVCGTHMTSPLTRAHNLPLYLLHVPPSNSRAHLCEKVRHRESSRLRALPSSTSNSIADLAVTGTVGQTNYLQVTCTILTASGSSRSALPALHSRRTRYLRPHERILHFIPTEQSFRNIMATDDLPKLIQKLPQEIFGKQI